MKFIYGRKPVIEALENNANIERIYARFGIEKHFLYKIKKISSINKIPLSVISKKKFEELQNKKNSQGIIAKLSSIKYFSLDEVITDLRKKTYPIVLMLERIQDPRNLGAILRTAACASVDAVIITSRESCDITETAIKTSAGGVFQLKICKMDNLKEAIERLKEIDFFIVCSSLEDATSYDEINYNRPIALIFGNEEKGLKTSTLKLCDVKAKIPIEGKLDSLNVSVAAGIFLYEIIRQRKTISEKE